MQFKLTSLAAQLAALTGVPVLQQRLQLSRAKHRSLAGHSLWAKRLARVVPGYAYDEAQFCGVDGAPAEVVQQRQQAFDRLSAEFHQRFARGAQMGQDAARVISDVAFTSRYRVPFQFSGVVRRRMPSSGFATASDGVSLTDLDGNRMLDLTGSYGVNVFGVDFYRQCVDEGIERTRALGPVLGTLHPLTVRNAQRLAAISGMDEVSFHMSGTEAVMQAVRLARYHTRRKYVVRFCGAYHGWWEDVQPGPGNPMPPRETYTLRDMDPRTLRVLATRNDIACVLVNPLQALHPNRNAPSDAGLIDGTRHAHFDREAYRQWLQQLREVCTERGIVLIFDEVFLGFRLAVGGAQEYFGMRADMVTYGKTLGGGLPVGVVCGRAEWMQRYREDRPADVCLARGTFNSHPYVMGAMAAFLDRLHTPEIIDIYRTLDERWSARVEFFNGQLAAAGVPARVQALSTVWTVTFTQPGRYHWLLQFYLRLQGLALSWVGSGRMIFTLNYPETEFNEVARRFVQACLAMQSDGWWWSPPGLEPQAAAKAMRRTVLRETLQSLWR